jgi:hypothetical protein
MPQGECEASGRLSRMEVVPPLLQQRQAYVESELALWQAC